MEDPLEIHGLDLELTGWFQVAWSGDLAPGQVVPLRYFGRDLVAYRNRSGIVHVHDRYCRHIGGSLAHGGTVVDDGLRCPFHGWVWGPDGRNVSIPYQPERPNRGRRLGTWHVDERNESIYVWFDAQGRDPLWEPPTALTLTKHAASKTFHAAWPEGRQHYKNLQIHPQMVIENAVDRHHFQFVHNTPISPVILEEIVEGPRWWARAGFGRGWTFHAHDAAGNLRADTLNTIEILWSGMGISVNTEETAEGIRVVCINTTPVEDGKSELFATYWISEEPGDIDHGGYARRLDEAKMSLPDDIEIWNHQIFLDPPALATEEGTGFRRIRRWARQFYPGDDANVVNLPTGVDDHRAPGTAAREKADSPSS